MDTETLAFLNTREKKLLATIERATLDLDGVRRAKAALLGREPSVDDVSEEGRGMSAPEMIRASLAERFPDGATVNQLHKHFQMRWGRSFSKPGLSVALSVMKDKGELRLEDQVWSLKNS